MWSLTISDLKAQWSFSRTLKTLCVTLSLWAVLCVPSLYAQRGNIRAGNGIKEKRDSVLTLNLDTIKVDSIAKAVVSDTATALRALIGPGSSGRTYLRGPYVDSTGALYSIGFAQDYMAQVNFSNSTSGGDSTQLVFNGSTGLLLPVAAGRQMRFELALIKTNYTGGGGSYFGITLPDSVRFSSDTTLYSVHFVAVGTSPRRYWLRVYETRADALSGLAPNLVDATKRMIFQIELDPLTTGYFPPTTTSFQFRITLRVRWQI